MKPWMTVGLLAGVLAVSARADQTRVADANLRFDVVSIKPHQPDDKGGRIGLQPGGRWIMTNVVTAGLILTAYPTKIDDYLQGAPAWVTTERFDVDARASFEPTPEQERVMLRALLADRFKLAAHYETQERPIYNLVVARADGRLGPALRRIDIDCATYKPERPAPGTPPPPAADIPPCGYRMSGGKTMTIVSGGRSMQSLGDAISSLAGRPVVDKTGLTGYYAFTLESGDLGDATSIFTALQEQLGLKLEAARGPIDIVVIDHIERPTDN